MKGASIKYALWLGSAFAFVALIAMFYMDRIDILALAAFAFGMVIVVGTLSGFNLRDGMEDERTRKIAAFSMLSSWICSIFFISALLVLAYFSWGHALSAVRVISLTLLLMLGTFYAWYIYYSLKGDVA